MLKKYLLILITYLVATDINLENDYKPICDINYEINNGIDHYNLDLIKFNEGVSYIEDCDGNTYELLEVEIEIDSENEYVNDLQMENENNLQMEVVDISDKKFDIVDMSDKKFDIVDMSDRKFDIVDMFDKKFDIVDVSDRKFDIVKEQMENDNLLDERMDCENSDIQIDVIDVSYRKVKCEDVSDIQIKNENLLDRKNDNIDKSDIQMENEKQMLDRTIENKEHLKYKKIRYGETDRKVKTEKRLSNIKHKEQLSDINSNSKNHKTDKIKKQNINSNQEKFKSTISNNRKKSNKYLTDKIKKQNINSNTEKSKKTNSNNEKNNKINPKKSTNSNEDQAINLKKDIKIFNVPTKKNIPDRKSLIKNAIFNNMRNSTNLNNEKHLKNEMITYNKIKKTDNDNKKNEMITYTKIKKTDNDNKKNEMITYNKIKKTDNENNLSEDTIYDKNTSLKLFNISSHFTINYLRKLICFLRINNFKNNNIKFTKDLESKSIIEKINYISKLHLIILKTDKICYLYYKIDEKISSFFETFRKSFYLIYKQKNCSKHFKLDYKLKTGHRLTVDIISVMISRYISKFNNNEDMYLFGQCFIIIMLEYETPLKIDQLIKLFFVILKSKISIKNSDELFICKIKALIAIINPDISFILKQKINEILHQIYLNRKIFRQNYCFEENLTSDPMIFNFVNIILYMAYPNNKNVINLVRPDDEYYNVYCSFLQNNFKCIQNLFK